MLVSIAVEDQPSAVSTQLERQDHFNEAVIDKLVAGGSDVLERFRDEALKLSKNSDGNGNNFGRIFSLLSIDGVTISAHSLKLGLNLIGFKTTDLDMKILMNRIDEDKSGLLELDEFKSFCLATTEDDIRQVCKVRRFTLF